MTVGGTVSMFAPEVGVPIAVGGAIVASIGQAMDNAAAQAKAIEIKSAYINVQKQTNQASAIADLNLAGMQQTAATSLVNSFNQGGTGSKFISSQVKASLGKTYKNENRIFICWLEMRLNVFS